MNHSEHLDLLAAALVAIQAAVPAIPKDANNPFFKSSYADLPTVVETAAPIITAHGVSVVQTVGYDGEWDTLTNLVLHTSGQWIADTMRLHLPKADPQGQGSAITYARRYAYMAALGLVADADDDGNAASKAAPKARKQAAPAQPGPQTFTAKQAKYTIYQAFVESGLSQEEANRRTASAWLLGESNISEQELSNLLAELDIPREAA